MNSLKTIAMTGFMGSGKSAVGRNLADRLQVPFRDLDSLIELGERKVIADIFKDRGEAYFRKLEREYFDKAVSQPPLILALGGGAIQQPEIADYLRKYTVTVYLEVPLNTLFERLQKSRHRPLLHGPDGMPLNDEQLMQRISSLLSERRPLYRCADITLSVQHDWTRDKTTDELMRLLEKHASTTITED